MKRIQCGEWLNDNIIDVYFACLQKKYTQHTFFPTAFWEKCASSDSASLTRWNSVKNMSQSRMVFIPVNIANTHWVMLVINVNSKVRVRVRVRVRV